MHRATKYGKRYLLSMHCKARSIVQTLRICLDSSKDVNQTLFSRSDVCMNKRKMTGERLGSRAIIHPRRVRCRRKRRDASKHPLMRSLLRVFSGIFLSSPFFSSASLRKNLDYHGRPRTSGIDISEVTRLPGLGAENSRADKSKGINIRRRNSSLSAADLPVPVKR